MVAGNHLDADARGPAGGDGRDRLLAGWVDEAEQTEEGETILNVGEPQLPMIGRNRFGRDRQNALPPRGELLDTPVPVGRIQLPVAALGGTLASTHAEQTLRRALDVDEAPPLVVVVSP